MILLSLSLEEKKALKIIIKARFIREFIDSLDEDCLDDFIKILFESNSDNICDIALSDIGCDVFNEFLHQGMLYFGFEDDENKDSRESINLQKISIKISKIIHEINEKENSSLG